MKLYRRHDKRIGFGLGTAIKCQLVHPEDQLLALRGHLLDLGAGGIGLRLMRNEVPFWFLELPIIVRADLPDTGELLRRTARMLNKRREGEQPEYGFAWDASGALSFAYERVQSQRLQRFLIRRERADAGRLDLERLGEVREESSQSAEPVLEPSGIVQVDRLPAGTT